MDVASNSKRFAAVTGIAFGLFWAVALVSVAPSDWPFDASKSFRHVSNYSGPLGSLLAWWAIGLVGKAFAWLLPLWLFLTAAAGGTSWRRGAAKWVFKTAVFVVLLNALFALTPYTAQLTSLRGSVGDTIASALSFVLGEIGSSIVIIAVLLLFVMGELGRLRALWPTSEPPKSRSNKREESWSDRWRLPTRAVIGVGRQLARGVTGTARALTGAARSVRSRASGEEAAEPETYGHSAGSASTAEEFDNRVWKPPQDEVALPIEIITAARENKQAKPATPEKRQARAQTSDAGKRRARQFTPEDGAEKPPLSEASLPPLTILQHEAEAKTSYSHETLKKWSGVLEDKLLNYGVEGRVTAVHHGPVVTTFEFEPAPGVRIKEIVSRADDLALAMRARSLRMIAPIPGRAAVGIEIPNPESSTVYLYDILDEISDKQRLGGVMIGLGVDVVGEPFLMNLCEAPHLLIAGTTGSGKSVCLNTILSSILFQYRPSDVQLLLVDPKMIEMSVYDGIPHLLHPVITDPKEAAKVLEFLTSEMTRRNELFRLHGVKNIESYNTKISLGKIDAGDETPERLPYIVLIVDELGDLALAKGVDIESLLARIAQMARAAGIHMVLATQRPSVDVIVGKTKANFPTRIAFRVATKVDSRTILDTIGADKLLGKGDMLYADARNPQPIRLHGAWVSEKNLEELISHWKSYQYDKSNLELHSVGVGAANVDEDVDPLFGDAKGVVVQYRQGSTSLLQRKLHIGYARAARLLDQLEQRGIVGPPDGSKPRQVYVESMDEVVE